MASGGITHFVNKVKSTAISIAGEVQPVLKVSSGFVGCSKEFVDVLYMSPT